MSQDILKLSLSELAHAYRQKNLSVQEVTEAYLAVIEPSEIYRLVTADRALAQAQRADDLFAKGVSPNFLQGIPLALKDLMDTKGDVTAAGTKVFASNSPAEQDCPAASRLDKAGAVFLGKTNMTELAFSGLGINPHYGTPGCALDKDRIPGGSSSGSGVAVAENLACAAIGSDTGGSVRIPAAFNGLVGLKTTDGVIPKEGVMPLSTTLDTLGPMTKTVEDAWHLWRVLADEPAAPFDPLAIKAIRLFAPTTILQENLEPPVAIVFQKTCDLLRDMGATVIEKESPLLQEITKAYHQFGGFAVAESYALYKDVIEEQTEQLDPLVTKRIIAGKDALAADYIRLGYERKRIQHEFWHADQPFEAVLAPTVAILPPKISDLAEEEAYYQANGLCLRNTSLFNFLGGPAVTVPCATTPEGLSIGFMIAAQPHSEYFLLSLAWAIEEHLKAK